MLATIGTIVGVGSFLVGLFVVFHERRRSPGSTPGKPLRARKKQRTIAIWTIGRFYQSLQQFDEYCDRLEKEPLVQTEADPTKPSREDLLRFAEAVLLTAAVDIVPFSQGKANLFHFADDATGHSRQIVSQVFTGAFPPSQVLSGVMTYREMLIEHDTEASSVAGECVRLGIPRLYRITKKSTFSGEEIKLGTTHIVGMPAHLGSTVGVDDFCRVPQGMPAAITVDLRIGFTRLLLPLIKAFAYRRGHFICHRLSRYSSLAMNSVTVEVSP